MRNFGRSTPLRAYPEAQTPRRLYRPEWEAELLDLSCVYDFLAQGRWFRQVSEGGTVSLGGQVYGLGRAWAKKKQQVEIKFDATQKHGRKKTAHRRFGPLETQLIQRGVSSATAVRLVRDYSADVIREKINVFDALTESNEQAELGNPPGFLVQSIKDNYQFAPSQLTKERKPEATSISNAASCRRAKPAESVPPEEKARRDAEQKRIDAYLADLSEEERERLEKRAFRNASKLLVDGYRRGEKSGNVERTLYYRGTIIRNHVRQVLGLVPQ